MNNQTGNLNLSFHDESLLKLNHEQVRIYIPAIIYLAVCMVMGVTGNAFVSYIYYYKLKATPANLFVVILSLSDLLGSLMCTPMDILVLSYPYVFYDDTACRVIRFVVMDSAIISGVIVFAISIDRFKKVCLPLGKQLTRRQVKIISISLITFATILSMPGLYVYGTRRIVLHGTDINATICSVSDKVDENSPKIFFIALMSVCFTLLFSFSTIYCLIAVKLCRYMKERKSLHKSIPVKSISNDDASKELTDSNDYIKENRRIDKMKKQKKKQKLSISEHLRSRTSSQSGQRQQTSFLNMTRTTLVMFFISLTWLLSYIPHLASVFIMSSNEDYKQTLEPAASAGFEISLRSFYLNNMINPWIYGIFNSRFRHEVLAMIKTTFCKCLPSQKS